MSDPLSYECGTTRQPLLFRTVGAVLSSAAAIWPQRRRHSWTRHQNVRLTYREVDERVSDLARGLLAYGLAPGDRVGIWSPNNLEWVLTQFATARAGLILVNINPAYRRSELDYALRKVGCRMLILAPVCKSSDYLAMIDSLIPERRGASGGRVASASFPSLEWVVQLGTAERSGFLSFDALCAAGRSVPEETLASVSRQIDPDQPVNIQFTSGTTGLPKGATLTHFNIVNNGHFVGEGMRITIKDRLCIPVPLYHCFGMVLGVLAAVTHGATIVMPSESFDAEAVLQAVAEEDCTALYGVPTMFIAELEHPRFREFDLSSLRTGIMAGAPCPKAVMHCRERDAYARDHGLLWHDGKFDPVGFQNGRVDDPLDKRVSTVGRVHPHVQVKLIDRDGRVVPRGAPGELLTRGYSVMRGYWEDPERTAEAVDTASWMRTPGIWQRSMRRILQHRRAGQGHDHPRRGEHLPSGG